MKIQPKSHNSIDIELEDGTILSAHHTLHDEKDYLFVKCNNALIQVEVAEGLQWKPLIASKSYIRLSAKGAD